MVSINSTAGSATHLYWPYLNSPSLSPLPLKSNLKLDRLQERPKAVASRTSSSLLREDM
jgi:hypothetical protein